jgi:AraC-like DNA-binding protein
MLGIAFECGFNSKASFNRSFKKETGLTPSEFKKEK